MKRLGPICFVVAAIFSFLSIPPGKAAASPDTNDSICIGRQISFSSQVLKEEKTLYVSLPEGYGNSTARYPVLYTFYNGDAGFIHTTGVVRLLADLGLAPELIVVSLPVDGRRDLTPTRAAAYGAMSGGADVFLRFLREELLPYVDREFRTDARRLVWSHSIGGTLIVYALLAAPDLFQVHLTSSPFFIYDGNERFLLRNAARLLKRRKNETNYLYMAVGNEPDLKPAIDEFVRILGDTNPPGLVWDYIQMDKEDHSSIQVRSLTEGLRAYFAREGWTGRR
jgi:predicted alpha/beta superfamily hydrolase